MKKRKNKQAGTGVKPVTPIPKTTSIFIGGVNADINCHDIRAHIKCYSRLDVELNDIQELDAKSKGKAFRVSVPQERVQDVISKWPKEIKAEIYSQSKSKGPACTEPRGQNKNGQKKHWKNGNNRPNSFRDGPAPKWSRPRSFEGTQDWRRPQETFIERNHWETDYLHRRDQRYDDREPSFYRREQRYDEREANLYRGDQQRDAYH